MGYFSVHSDFARKYWAVFMRVSLGICSVRGWVRWDWWWSHRWLTEWLREDSMELGVCWCVI